MNLKHSRGCHQSKCSAPLDTQRLGYTCNYSVVYFRAHCKTLRTYFVSRTQCQVDLIQKFRFHSREYMYRDNGFWISVPPQRALSSTGPVETRPKSEGSFCIYPVQQTYSLQMTTRKYSSYQQLAPRSCSLPAQGPVPGPWACSKFGSCRQTWEGCVFEEQMGPPLIYHKGVEGGVKQNLKRFFWNLERSCVICTRCRHVDLQ